MYAIFWKGGNMLKLTVFVAALAVLTIAEKESFENYKVFRILPSNSEQNVLLHHISELSEGYSFWNGPTNVNSTADLMVAPKKLREFGELMRITETKYVPYIDNVQALIDAENPSHLKLSKAGFDWTSYHTLEEIYAWLDSLAELYPDKVEVIVAGYSHENRPIKGVKISYKNGNPGVFLEGNIHAREWITSATLTYIINQLLTSNDPDIKELAERHDWYIFPVFNPDGFHFTHNKNRLWRKTRKPYSVFCVGADPNRNWGYMWNHGGASSLPCAETYAGSGPFSDTETQTASKYISSIADKFYAYIAFHSYSQLLLFPYGHTTEHLDNHDELMEIGKETIQGLAKRYGTRYITGNIAETIYVASGSSMDWVKATFKTPISYTYELRDKGRHGFLLPADQIIPTGEETLDSLIAMFKAAKARGYPKNV